MSTPTLPEIRALCDRICELDKVIPCAPWANWKNYTAGQFDNCRLASPAYRQLMYCHAPKEVAIPTCDFISESRTFSPAAARATLAQIALVEVWRRNAKMNRNTGHAKLAQGADECADELERAIVEAFS